MKIKRSIFATVSGDKINSGGAQSSGVARHSAAREDDESDSSRGIGRADGNAGADAFYERLILRSATIDELLSDEFAPLGGQYVDTELVTRRLAAWCRASTGGASTRDNLALFERRLARDGHSITEVMARFGAVRRTAPQPAWLSDAKWIETALQSGGDSPRLSGGATHDEPCAFEQLLAPVVERAEALLRAGIDAELFGHLSEVALSDLRRTLLQDLSGLCAAPLYERFAKARKDAAPAATPQPQSGTGTAVYDRFVVDMKAGGFRRLFEDKPVQLRLLATLVRQWIDTSREFVLRLDADLPALRRDLLDNAAAEKVAKIEGELSDPHNFGRSVKIVTFADGTRTVYKPKDLRLDIVWHDMIERLNRADPPVTLQAVRTIARDGYGWTEFVAHTGCTGDDGVALFFRRAGAWLALFHLFAATDMHQENMIAAGDHPVPIDLETILQPSAEEHKVKEPEGEAFDAAMDIVGNSVMTVGLLPAYGRSVDNNVFAMGGMTADWGARTVITWNDINTDPMRPAKAKEAGATNTNLPHSGGRYAKFGDHIDDFVAGFEDYAHFLWRSRAAAPGALFDGFAGLPVRKVVRPTRFYYMLLQRLRNHQPMDDGATWSAQADFIARLSEWDKDSDPLWPLFAAERSALVALNVPHFVTPSDGDEICDLTGTAARTAATPGLKRAVARAENFDAREIAWQVEVISENTNSVAKPAAPEIAAEAGEAENAPTRTSAAAASELFIAEADRIAAEISERAIRRGPGAAWLGLDWLGDSEVFQLVCLGPDLYNGASGIAVFLAAHAAVTGHKPSGELALAALSHLRKNLKGRNAARLARALGLGGATGLGSIIYAFAVIAKCLDNADLLADANSAARLFTDDLIAADKQLDVMGGSSGGVLGLLRLYRDTQSSDTLARAIRCGEHLLAQRRLGLEGLRTWATPGTEPSGKLLNGMSHGAAGFAYALASLAAAAGRSDFAQAAAECVAFEDSNYDAARHNWPDLRTREPHWPCQWCHGATGIGLSRLAINKRHGMTGDLSDIRNAIAGVQQNAPTPVDTLCCGALGGIEFLCDAGVTLARDDLRDTATRRLTAVVERAAATGDYRWNVGKRQFNLGLFRGLSGVGYTLLRQARMAPAGPSLPNVLIWE
jgi:type 2 lantibiotic biosynthesis protein LanM